MATVAIMGVLICLALILYNKEIARLGVRGLVTVAALVAIAVMGRGALAVFPSVQPVSAIVMLCGLTMGGGAGLLCGLCSALLSDLFLGLGPQTVWYMVLWGALGVLSSFCRRLPSWATVALGFAWGFVHGWVMNLWWYSLGLVPWAWSSFLLACGLSFHFDLAHALVNAALLLGLTRPVVLRLLGRASGAQPHD